jgi:VanZ family protein
MTDEEKTEMIERYDGRVRKLAHFCAYALLGCLLCVSACHAPFTLKMPYLWPFLISAVFAMTDEYHQTFVDGRAGRFSDVIIDSSGAACGIAFASVVILVVKRIRSVRGA